MAVLRQPDLEALLVVFAFDEQQEQNHFQSSSSYFTLLSVIKYISSQPCEWKVISVLNPVCDAGV